MSFALLFSKVVHLMKWKIKNNPQDASQLKLIVTLDVLCAAPLGFSQDIPWKEVSCPVLYLQSGFAQIKSIFLCGKVTLGFQECRIRG